MTKRHIIILTSILLVILITIIAINFNLAEAKALPAASLNFKTPCAALLSRQGVSDVYGMRTLVLDSKNVGFLQDGALDVSAEKLSGASLHLLDA